MEERKGKFTIGQRKDLEHLRNDVLEKTYAELQDQSALLDEAFDVLMTEPFESRAEKSKPSQETVTLYRNYSRLYGDVINLFEQIVDGSVTFDGVDISSFIQRAKAAPQYRNHQTNTQLLMMQQYGIMSQVSRFVYQLYLSFVDHSLPVFRYMQEGARHLGYTDKRLFGRMYGVMLKKNRLNLANAVLTGLLGGGMAYPVWYYKRKGAGEGVAAADYPYSFTSKYKKSVQIKPVKVNGPLSTVYNTNDCSIRLGLGEQAALFQICNDITDRVILSFAGTGSLLTSRGRHNVVTDAAQILFGPETTYLAAVGLLLEVKQTLNKEIWVTGHSLGGGLMQFAVTGVGGNNIYGVGFNSAGLSDFSKRTLTAARIHKAESMIGHICATTDYISPVGSQIGNVYYVETEKKFSHSLDHLNKAINGEKISCWI